MKLDCHVHIVGNGSSGSGCKLKLSGRFSFQARALLHSFGLPQRALNGDLDTLYISKLVEYVRSSSLDKALVLAHEDAYDEEGNKLPDFGSLYVPNKYVLSICKQHPELLPAVSIHPGRKDALEELERSIDGGAVAM